MSHFKDSIEACDALLEKHGAIARRTPGLFPEERRRLERAGLISPAPVEVYRRRRDERGQSLGSKATQFQPQPGSRSRRAAEEYLSLTPVRRYGAVGRLAIKYGISGPAVSQALKALRRQRAVALNTAQPKAA